MSIGYERTVPQLTPLVRKRQYDEVSSPEDYKMKRFLQFLLLYFLFFKEKRKLIIKFIIFLESSRIAKQLKNQGTEKRNNKRNLKKELCFWRKKTWL